jgi:predicted ArsR family transcriptional regulator
MASSDFGRRVSGVAALAEPVRRDLYWYVVSQSEPVGRDQAAAGVGVPRHTAKFHLDKLVEEGLLVTESRRLTGRAGPGAGRPAKVYRRSDRQLTVTVPERRYELAAELFADAIEAAAREGTDTRTALHGRVEELGASIGRRIAQQAAGDLPATSRLAAIGDALAEYGYEPRRDGDRVLLANCPFHELARRHVDLVCGMNHQLLGALTRQVGPGVEARLEPDAGRCCVLLAATGAGAAAGRPAD